MTIQTKKTLKRLKCHLEAKVRPELVLNQLKIEVHHDDPKIVQIHDALSKDITQHIIAEAAPFMSRSKVIQNVEVNNNAESSTRTSTTTWLPQNLVTDKISKKVETISGLDLSVVGAAEDLQITSYGIGGHYNPHVDTAYATVMFYVCCSEIKLH